ncbi:MAG: ABC transporter substrate-binding protein [Acidobacteria bacterium]|nr:ABC transporter substrate-binding protein [Acidobacteriota bacterium]
MAARAKGLTILLVLVAICAYVGRVSRAEQAIASRPATAPATRIVSLVPALTEMLFAIEAGPQVVAVSSYDDFPPEVQRLPRVGALLDPDVERILSLRPDLVLTYGSQDGLEAQLARAGIRTYSYRHGGLEVLFRTMSELGTATGHAAEAGRTASGIRRQLDAIRARVRGRSRPRVLLVFGREPQSLKQVYVSGGRGFLLFSPHPRRSSRVRPT